MKKSDLPTLSITSWKLESMWLEKALSVMSMVAYLISGLDSALLFCIFFTTLSTKSTQNWLFLYPFSCMSSARVELPHPM